MADIIEITVPATPEIVEITSPGAASVIEINSTIMGPQGLTGLQGLTGTNGTQGLTGPQGLTGISGLAVISDTEPASPYPNMQWWDSSIATLKIYYNDGNSSQWVDAVAPVDTSINVAALISTDAGNSIVVGTDSSLYAPIKTYIQNTTPSIPVGQSAIWVQTGLGALGNDMTIWIEDGL